MITARFNGQFDDFHLNAEFRLNMQGVSALFGQSGCGKTTVLRCLAGLERVADGHLVVDGVVWQDDKTFLPPNKRPIGYVFQDANLFDHLDVKGNVLFAQKRTHDQGGPQLSDISALMGIDHLLDRAVRTLSGGERQRVAIARALLSSPRLLLMDEPLSALDRFSKDEIIPYLEKMHEALSIPVVYISHDSQEVERLADYMLLMEKGRVVKSGPLLDMLADPKLFIAKSSKTASVLEADVAAFDADDHLSTLRVADKTLYVPGFVAPVGESRRVRILATDVSLAREKPSQTTILNVFESQIVEIAAIDEARVNVVLALGPSKLIARITTRSLRKFAFEVGQTVYAQVKGVSMVERRKK